jgi:hypothetical protein
MKYLVMVLVLMFTVPAMADVKTHGLSPEQQATLEANAAQMKLTNAKAPVISGDIIDTVLADPESINKYAQIGQAIASSLASAARELGVEINNFAETGVGKFIMVMTVAHFFGAQIVSFSVGFFFMIPMTLWIIYRMNKFIKTAEITYDAKGKEIGRVYHTAEESSHSRGDGMSAFGAQTLITVFGMILVVIQAFIYLP